MEMTPFAWFLFGLSAIILAIGFYANHDWEKKGKK